MKTAKQVRGGKVCVKEGESARRSARRVRTYSVAPKPKGGPERSLRKKLETEDIMHSVPRFETKVDRSMLSRKDPEILQLNIGLYCNQACSHCHVESSPARTEMMDLRTAERVMSLLPSSPSIHTLDLTGGAPELCTSFRYLVETATKMGYSVIDRCNLTVLLEEGQEDLGEFLAKHKVQVVASLPCYAEKNVDEQRGGGVFEKSIKGLKMLNRLGYGCPGSDLQLNLVYNPNGAFLAPEEKKLEEAYKVELDKCYGITFNRLLCLNNMPVKRYSDYLHRSNKLEDYMQLLLDNFNPAAVDGLMCKNLFSISWDGRIFDCDFNQQLDLPLKAKGKGQLSVFDVESLSELASSAITLGQHCYGCTAGSGSSCSGSTS